MTGAQAASAGVMFAELSNDELTDLVESLCDSVHWAKRFGWPDVAADLQETEHVAWHALCVRRGRRCLQDVAS